MDKLEEFKTCVMEITQQKADIEQEIANENKRAKVLSEEIRENPEKETEYRDILNHIEDLYLCLDLTSGELSRFSDIKQRIDLFISTHNLNKKLYNNKLTTCIGGKQPVAATEIENGNSEMGK
ncbi:MAG: hypothetical protein LBM01_00135 [Christensenellaceae bacterium]|jgi:predicted  nucleic acid-binding Zn-ribbon protein|nr:hypothetical protein [Christensenellaceae bacterium]